MGGELLSANCYDSLIVPRARTRGTQEHKLENRFVKNILNLFIDFWNGFVMRNDRYLDFDMFKDNFQQKECPQQPNSYNCSLYMSIIILHLLSDVPITKHVFTPDNIKELKIRLISTLANSIEGNFTNYKAYETIPADIIHYSFPKLRWDYAMGPDPDRFL